VKHAASAALLGLSLAVAGCSGALLGPQNEPPETYRLETPAVPPAAARLPLVLTVARPRAAESLDSERIAVARPDHRFDQYAGLRWSEPAPQMLQSLLVGSLQSAGRYEAVLAAPSRVPVDLLLDVELRRFEARYSLADAAPVVRVEMQLTLVDPRRSRRIAGVLVSAEAAAAADRRGEVMAAFEQATAKALADAAAWLGGVEPPATP
jgi:cholesterol transport system auxiliary component